MHSEQSQPNLVSQTTTRHPWTDQPHAIMLRTKEIFYNSKVEKVPEHKST